MRVSARMVLIKNMKIKMMSPVGMYFLKNKIKRKLPDLYGDGAYRINYPNVYDKLNKYTGSGIWIHGTPQNTFSRAPESSDGCIVLSNHDLKKIANIIIKSKYSNYYLS